MDVKSEINFEQAMERLEEIVGKLDVGDLPLDKSLLLFEERGSLARQCSIRLKDAEGRLEMLLKRANGTADTEPLEI